jgi:hypothetical protein
MLIAYSGTLLRLCNIWRFTERLFSVTDPLPVAVLASGMIASPESLSVSWGYSIDDKVKLSRDCKSLLYLNITWSATNVGLSARGCCSSLVSEHRELHITVPYLLRTSDLRTSRFRASSGLDESMDRDAKRFRDCS